MKNSQKWNRILTGAAAVSLAIGTMAPMAFAASASTQYNTRTVNVGNGFTAVVQGLVAQDQGHATEFLPIYYLMQGLGKMGYIVNWNGGTRTLNITTPTGVTVTAPTATVGTPGANQMVIQLNGANIMLAPRVVAKDPASGVMTTFAPIYYLNQALKSAGFTNTYNGQSWTLTGTAASQTGTLGTITVSNQSQGTGTSTSPAVSLNGAIVSLSTTLKDAQGNPLPNTAVTFEVSNYGESPSPLPTVSSSNGTVIPGTDSTNSRNYSVYTDSNGVATITVKGPSSSYAYEVVANAPYSTATGASINSQPVFVDFVAGNSAGLSPNATAVTPYSAALGSVVPVTVVLPPNAQGQPQANVLLTLQNSSANGNWVTSTGTVTSALGQIQVTTNSAGVATAYLQDANAELVQVSVLPSSMPSGVSAPDPTFIYFGQTGVAANFNGFSVSNLQPNIGDTVTVSGQLVDPTGNPVPNGQILVTAENTNGGNAFSYVSGTTTTAFPVLGTNFDTLSKGTPATNAYGEVVTADNGGNFSVELTDSRAYPENYAMYAVANGQVASSTPLPVPTADVAINFHQSTSLAQVSVGAFDSYVESNSDTSTTGYTAQINGGGITLGGLDGAANASQIAYIYAQPQNSAGHHGGALPNQNESYSLSVDNGGEIYSINGVDITPSAAINLQYTPGTGFSVNGGTAFTTLAAPGAAPEDFKVGVINGNSGATTLTIQSGSVSSTAAINFTSGAASYADTFSPVMPTVNAGQQVTVQFTLEDANGNPVPNSITNIQTDGSPTDPLWISAVNGITLQQTEDTGAGGTNPATEPTPIPMGTLSTPVPTYTVNLPGVVSWTGGTTLEAYSNSSGVVTLQLQAGGGTYWTSLTSLATETEPTSASSLSAWSNETGSGASYDIAFQTTAPDPVNDTALGVISWTQGTTAPTSTPVGSISPAVTVSGWGTTNTQINWTAPSASDSLYYTKTPTAATAPNIGTAKGVQTAYTLGSTFDTSSDNTDYYVNVYEVSGGNVVGFTSVPVATPPSANAGAIQNLAVAPGTTGNVVLSATPLSSSDTFYYLDTTSTSAPVVTTSTPISSVTGAAQFTLGSTDITPADTNLYVYEVNSSGDVVAVGNIGKVTKVTANDSTSTPGALGTAVKPDISSAAIGDTITVAGTTFKYVASGASASAGTFTTVADLVNAINTSTATNQYVIAAADGTAPLTTVDIQNVTATPVAVFTNNSTDITGITGPAAVATLATATITVTAGATYSGTYDVTVNDGANVKNVTVSVPVTAGESIANVVAAINSALSANSTITSEYAVTTNGSSTVTLTQHVASAVTPAVTFAG